MYETGLRDLLITAVNITSLSGVKTLVPGHATLNTTHTQHNGFSRHCGERETGIWEGGDLHIDDSVKGSSSVYNLEGTTSE